MNYPSLHKYSNAYFVGIGGIGMSALARYFKLLGWNVAGYDKTSTTLTQKLEEEGITIHYEDWNNSIPEPFNDKDNTLVVYTPAIPKNLGELLFFQHYEFDLFKRSEVLGMITKETKGIGVAGTHGKTTTSTMLAHLLYQSSVKVDAFLGGISTNFNSNLVFEKGSDYAVIEADEFDRSFLKLHPKIAIVTSVDPDHLDIYGDASHFNEGFQLYVDLLPNDGLLVKRYGIELKSESAVLTYGVEESSADYHANNLRFENGTFNMDVRTPKQEFDNLELGIPGIHNAENALACIAVAEHLGLSNEEIRMGLASFRGVKRRFEYHIKSQNLIYIDDYAHHPTEIKSLLDSVRLLYPNQKITGVFQPHLFSRTRDFFDGFVKQLSRLDEAILMPIYPAREEPIEGVSSDALLGQITSSEKCIMNSVEVISHLGARNKGVILTIGAGDIDRVVEPLKNALL